MGFFKCEISDMEFLEKSLPFNRMIHRAGILFSSIIRIINIIYFFLFGFGKIAPMSIVYLGMHVVFFVFCAVFLYLDVVRDLPSRSKNLLYMASSSMLLFCHLAFTIFDVCHAGIVGNYTVFAASMIFTSLLVAKPGFTLCNLIVSYIIYSVFLCLKFSFAEMVNFSVISFLCMIICIIRYKQLCDDIFQTELIDDLRTELLDTQRDFRLSIDQYELIREQGCYISFKWDINDDSIVFSKEWLEYFDLPETIPNFTKFVDELDTLIPEQKNLLKRCMNDVKNGTGFQKHELLVPIKNGENGWFELMVIAQKDSRDMPLFGIGLLTDITDRKERMAQLELEIQLDLFTGLFNKTSIERYGSRRIAELKRDEMMLSLILDMDDFKDINDRYGHPVGDYVLKETAALIRQYAPKGARMGRIGGDEFMVLMASFDQTEFKHYAYKLIQEVPEIRWNGLDVRARCSIGLSAALPGTLSFHQLYEKTDNALYQAKRLGKSQVYCDIPNKQANPPKGGDAKL